MPAPRPTGRYPGRMSALHSVHVRIDAMSPRWSDQYYRFEQHYNFRLADEEAVQAALARLAHLAEELRNPVQDAIPAPAADEPADEVPAHGPYDNALLRMRESIEQVNAEMGGPPHQDEGIETQLIRAQRLIDKLAQYTR